MVTPLHPAIRSLILLLSWRNPECAVVYKDAFLLREILGRYSVVLTLSVSMPRTLCILEDKPDPVVRAWCISEMQQENPTLALCS